MLLRKTFLGHQYDLFLIEPILFSEQSEFRTSVGSSLSPDRACVGRCCLVGPIVIHCVGRSKGPSHLLRVVRWKDFLNGVKELGIVDLFLKDWDESMSVDGVKTLPDVEFQKPARGLLSTSRAFTAPFCNFPSFVRPRGCKKRERGGYLAGVVSVVCHEVRGAQTKNVVVWGCDSPSWGKESRPTLPKYQRLSRLTPPYYRT